MNLDKAVEAERKFRKRLDNYEAEKLITIAQKLVDSCQDYMDIINQTPALTKGDSE